MEVSTLITTILTLLQLALSQLGSSSTVANQVIAALINIVPIAVTLGTDVVNQIKSVISVLENSGDLTTDQLNTLASLSNDLDASWATTIANYNAVKGIVATPPAAAAALPEEDPAQASLPLSVAPVVAQ
jgi:predicted PurR-regulated permease PerM